MADGTPEGGEENNRQERTWGEHRKVDFELKDHLTLAEANDWLDFERGAKVAGSKFYFLKGSLVRLEFAVTQLILPELSEAGFTPMIVPHMVTGRVAAGTGYLPRGEERQIYKIEGEVFNLIATSDMPLTGYYADEILDLKKLPATFVGRGPAAAWRRRLWQVLQGALSRASVQQTRDVRLLSSRRECRLAQKVSSFQKKTSARRQSSIYDGTNRRRRSRCPCLREIRRRVLEPGRKTSIAS